MTVSQAAGAEAPLSVTDAMMLAKRALEGVRVRVMGEVSELSEKPGYKAVYFTLADEGAALSCLMWNNDYSRTGFSLKRGMLVEVTGRFSVYASKGRMNFVVSQMSMAGEGALRMKVAALASALEAEGLMEAARKRPVPVLPRRIGLVTSPRGKAVHDVLRTLRRRYPLAEVLLAGCAVEGADAPRRIAEALAVVAEAMPDVVLLVRGGGSYEDLMPFNDEGLARAIAAMPVPVVTGIGHEPDTTIADMVSDLRASTPTAAAECVSTSIEELRQATATASARIKAAAGARLAQARQLVAAMAARPALADPCHQYRMLAMSLEQSGIRLAQALPGGLRESASRLANAKSALLRQGMALAPGRRHPLDAARSRLAGTPQAVLQCEAQMAMLAAQLEALSPLAVLARGFAVAFDGSGSVLSSVSKARIGSEVELCLSDGRLGCTVNSVMKAGEGFE